MQAPLSRRTQRAVNAVAAATAADTDWGEAYVADWERLRGSLAQLINVAAEDVALTRGTGHAISILARGLDWRTGDNVVSVRMEYPANVFPWTLLKSSGVEARMCETVDGRILPERIIDLIDDRTRVVSLSWVQFWNGFRADLGALGAACREKGVIFMVDAIQALGAIPLDARAMNIDVVACGASKWMLGPGGIGFCYVSPEIVDRLLPPLVGAGTLQMQPGVAFEEVREFRGHAQRFEESSVSWFDIAAFLAGLDLLAEVGAAVVEERVLRLTRMLGEGMAESGYSVVEPWPRSPEESSGIVSIRPSVPPVEASAALEAEGVKARVFRDILRFSPHFYNTEEDIERALHALRKRVPVGAVA